MTTITELLAPVKAMEEAATEGPWKVDRGGDFQSIKLHTGSLWINVVDASHQTPPHGEWIDSPDIDFIAGSRTVVPLLVAALEAVEDLCVIAETEFDGMPRKPFMIHPDALRTVMVHALKGGK